MLQLRTLGLEMADGTQAHNVGVLSQIIYRREKLRRPFDSGG